LGLEVTHCQFMQGVQNCYCFHQAAVLPYSFNIVCSAPSPARQGTSVLSTALNLRRLAEGSPSALLWDIDLSSHPSSQPLCLTSCLLSASLPALGAWLVTPTPSLSLCYFYCLHLLSIHLFAPPQFTGTGSADHPSSAVTFRLQFTLYAFQFCWGRIQSANGLHWIMFPGQG
jgi:hypothetical protein